MTTPAASDAAERLREIVKPGGTVYAVRRPARTGDTAGVTLWVPVAGLDRTEMARIHFTVAEVLGLHVRPGSTSLRMGADFSLTRLLDRLSVALFGETGLIKGEYL